jgi:tetratricopeptide (TPR) repeat protein
VQEFSYTHVAGTQGLDRSEVFSRLGLVTLDDDLDPKRASASGAGKRTPPQGRRLLAAHLLLVLAVVVAYSPLWNNGFTSYDDPDYFTSNEHVLSGLSAENWNWAWTTRHAANWHPLTWFSHQLDAELFGRDSARGPHAVNLFWHIATVLMLARFLTLASGRAWASLVVAGLVALHPLNVEAVAWIAQRKSVLSSFLCFASLTAWLSYARRGSWTGYFLAWVASCLALLAKPMVVTLPFVLLLLDLWPLRRWSRKNLGRLLAEKIPFVLPVLALAAATLWAQQSAMSNDVRLAVPVRLANSIVAYVGYLRAAVWPTDLAVFYPHPLKLPPALTLITSSAVLLAITLLVAWRRKRQPQLAFGWVWYLATLVPAIGLVQVGTASMADRYAYIPLVGIFVAVVWSLDAWATRSIRVRVLATTAVAIAVLLSSLTFRQSLVWRDSFRLFEHAMQVTEGNYVAHMHLGAAYQAQGDFVRAAEHYDAARQMGWKHPKTMNSLATIWSNQGRKREAKALLRGTLRAFPRSAETHYELARIELAEGNRDEARRLLVRTLELAPKHAAARELLRQISP